MRFCAQIEASAWSISRSVTPRSLDSRRASVRSRRFNPPFIPRRRIRAAIRDFTQEGSRIAATYKIISLLSRCKRRACLRAKEKVRGASPRESASLLPRCLSSYRASFVNLYSSVRVRPEAPVYSIIAHHSPITVTVIERRRGFTSHSKWNTCCHWPRTSLPSLTGTISDGPRSVACRCEWPLPSCQARS